MNSLDHRQTERSTCLSLNLAMPKSQTFARPLRLRSTFDDFRSLHRHRLQPTHSIPTSPDSYRLKAMTKWALISEDHVVVRVDHESRHSRQLHLCKICGYE